VNDSNADFDLAIAAPMLNDYLLASAIFVAVSVRAAETNRVTTAPDWVEAIQVKSVLNQ
jgi:hypothetical protein